LYLTAKQSDQTGADDVKRIAGARKVRREPTEEADRPPMELRVGARVRHARLLNRMRLKDVAERAKCSEGMLSKIENDRAVPSLTTLHRLCKALNLSVSALLNKNFVEPFTILHARERTVIGHASGSGSEGVKAEVIIPHAEGRLLQGFVVIIEPGGTPAASCNTRAKRSGT
jgi:transcriptional regulator with XRE-family HTH domain